MGILTTVNMGYRQRYAQMNKLLYMTDGYHQPKMYDGVSLVNWGLTPPSSTPTVAASSTGANILDLCENLWTPANVVVHDCESVWTLAISSVNSVATLSQDAKVGTFSSATLLGYASEPLTTNTVLMLHCDGVHGATSMVDSSSYAHIFTFGGTAALTTTYKKWGTASLSIPADDDVVSCPQSAAFNLGTAAFTIDLQIRFGSAINQSDNFLIQVGSKWPAADRTGPAIAYNSSTGAWSIRISPTTGFSRTKLVPLLTQTHIRLTRYAGYLYFFVNGVLQGAPAASTDDCPGATNGVYIGASTATYGMYDFCIDEVRIERGVAFSVSDFIPPTLAYGSFATPSNDPIGLTGVVSYKDLVSVDYSGYYGLQFWVKSVKTTQAKDAALVLCGANAGTSVLERADFPVLQAGTWTQVSYKFTNPAALTAVLSVALSLSRDIGQNAFYLDDIRAIRCLVTLETDPTRITQGASSIKLSISGNIPSGTLLAYRDFASTNMVGDTLVSASIRCDKPLGYQQFQYLLDNTAACVSPLESINFPDSLVADAWHNVSFALATPAALGAVISHGITLKDRNIGPCTLWIDDIKRATAVAGNLTGRYFVWVSYYNSKYDKESDLSPISAVINCQSQAINLTSIPLSADTQVDMRRIYRSAAGGTVPYLDSTINDNTTAILTLNKSDASILAATRHPSLMAGAGKFQAPPTAPYLVQTKNRIVMGGSNNYNRGTVTTAASATFTFTSAQLDDSFIGRYIQIIGDQTIYLILTVNAIAGTCVARPIDDIVAGIYRGTPGAGKSYYISSGTENTIFTSYIDDNDTSRPHGFPIEFAQDVIEGSAGDVVTGLGLVGDAILVTKNYSTHLLEGNYPPFSVSKLSSVIGCISHDTICSDEKAGAIWLAGEQGVAYCNGSSVGILSTRIDDIFSGGHALSLNAARFQYAHAVYDTSEKLYYLFCSSSSSSVNDVCLVLDVSREEPQWYYFTNIEAASSTLVYSATGIASIYITDYDGFQYQLNTGWYDGVVAGSTLSGTATSAGVSTLNDTGAAFYTTGSGLRSIPLLVYKVSTGETWVYKITSNTAQQLTISGVFTEIPSTSDYRYYVGAYQLDWKSKNFELLRPTDKKLLMDAVLNNYKLAVSQKVRIQLLKNLAGTSIVNQLRDLSEGEEQVMLVRERVSQAQWQISGFVHGQNIQIVSLGLRLKARGIR